MNNAGRDQVMDIFRKSANRRLEAAMMDTWERVHTTLTHMSKQLTTKEDGKASRLHDTMLSNARELVTLLQHLNFTNDPALTQAGEELSRVLRATNIEELRKHPSAREDTKRKVDDILSKFAF